MSKPKKERLEKICPQCSKLFKVPLDKAKTKFCSKKCSNKFRYDRDKGTRGHPYMMWWPFKIWNQIEELSKDIEDKHPVDKYKKTILTLVKKGLEEKQNE